MSSMSASVVESTIERIDRQADLAIEVKGVSVAYRAYEKRPTSIKESVVSLVRQGRAQRYSYLNALSDVTLRVTRGEVLGLIGSNGSGKSTLLKVLAGVLKPTSGTVRVSGSVASLIELGVGFDPELNAVENIYLNGSLHKKSSKQIRERVHHILEFAELTHFATTPVKYFSSGMAARLGFAVAIDIDPDVLLVDEVLAVGDERFQEKCNQVFKSFLERNKTIVIISHDLNMIEKLADEVALLSRGQLIFRGDPTIAVHLYRDPRYKHALE